ncbi:MAG: hypothetical protein V5A43_09035 [Haloarculaceae archaeon]
MDKETRYQILIAIGGVLAFIAVAVAVGSVFGEDANAAVTAMSPTGGIALVATIAFFILLMAGLGIWLERQDFES